MVGSLMCRVCDEQVPVTNPVRLRPQLREFCGQHRHGPGGHIVAIIGPTAVIDAQPEEVLDRLDAGLMVG